MDELVALLTAPDVSGSYTVDVEGCDCEGEAMGIALNPQPPIDEDGNEQPPFRVLIVRSAINSPTVRTNGEVVS